MGSCCGCFPKKTKPKVSGRRPNKKSSKTKSSKESPLYLASLRKQTISGFTVNTRVKPNLSTNKQLETLKNNPQIDWRVRRIASPPYGDFTYICQHLYLTGFWGLSKENIDSHNIKCIISTTYEMPKYQIKGIQCIRLPVSIVLNMFKII